jgi:hypothetical protein
MKRATAVLPKRTMNFLNSVAYWPRRIYLRWRLARDVQQELKRVAVLGDRPIPGGDDPARGPRDPLTG